jgi:uncharacterized protein (TIGR02266 family)
MQPEGRTLDAKRKILVVDDTAMFRELESIFLARFGVVITANSGEKALSMARREQPAVIVSDLHMRGMDGDTLCRHIRTDAALRDTPVIIVISGENARDRARAVRSGADDIVAKPVSRMNLVEAVSRFLRAPRQAGLSRVNLETHVRIRSHGAEAWGRSLNVSRGGIFVAADDIIPTETEVEIEFQLPETSAPMSSTARVAWARDRSTTGPAGMGLQFLALGREVSRRIESFVYEREGATPPRETASGGGAA